MNILAVYFPFVRHLKRFLIESSLAKNENLVYSWLQNHYKAQNNITHKRKSILMNVQVLNRSAIEIKRSCMK